jgi:hypothetical protein
VPIATSHQQEGLSLAYLQAVVADCGMTLTVRDTDYGVDASLYEIRRGNDGNYFEVGRPVDIQLKSTTSAKVESDNVKYDLNVRNYIHLRDPNAGVPRILMLLVLDKQPGRVEVTEHSMTIRACMYWSSLKGFPPTTNRQTVRVGLPRRQIVSTVELKAMVESTWRND